MPVLKILMCSVCCIALATGCDSVPEKWPELSTEDPPDKNVQPPSWYKPAARPDPWPLGAEPEHGTSAWRNWVAMRYNSRALARPAAVAPKIDGKLDDAAWKGAATGIPFVDPNGGPATPGTTVFLAYDSKNLYVAARLDEPDPAKIRAGAENGRQVSLDDHLAVDVAPNWRAKQAVGYALRVNSKGVFAAALRAASDQDAPLSAAAVVGEKDWTVEVAIPLNRIGVEAEDLWGQIWAFRFVRQRYAGGSGEVSSWTRVLDARRGTINSGYVIFKGVRPEEPPPKPKDEPKEGPADKPKDEPTDKPVPPKEGDKPAEPAPKVEPDKKDAGTEKAGENDGT